MELKIALVKQDVYQDLYVCARDANATEMLFSSIMRVGPIGLKTIVNADFLIVEEERDTECQIWTDIFPDKVALFRQLKNKPMDQLPGRGFLSPGSQETHDRYACKVKNVDWGKYDVVISLNVSVPYRIIKQYPQVLWCYMMGETSPLMDKVYFGYDVALNQLSRGIVANGLGPVDFPYTFTGPTCLEEIVAATLGRASKQEGIYAEVNTTTERPVREVPHYKPLKENTGHSIRIHQQKIKDNLKEVYDAKYFVKVGGRPTRGNSVIEAISLGTPVLMNPAECTHSQLLPPESWVHSIEEAVEKVQFFDSDGAAYQKLLQKQRQLLQQFVVSGPLQSIHNAYICKQSMQSAPAFRSAPVFTKTAIRSRLKKSYFYKLYNQSKK